MKRSRHTIISQILELCQDGALKTRIVYQANLNFKTVIPYIDLLIKNELLETSPNTIVIYKTTAKGARLLREFKRIRSLLPEIYDIAQR